jgi:hypothetical protein
MAALPTSPQPTPETAPLSQAERIVDTFVAPSKTFTDLRRSASWWVPFLLLAVVAIAFAYAVDTKVGFQQVVENQIQKTPRLEQQLDQLPPAERARQVHARAVGSRYFMYGFPLVTLIFSAVFAGIYLGSFKFGANADLTYGRSFAVVVYAALPEAIRGLLAIITLFAGVAPDSFNLQNPVATNLGVLFDQATSPFLYGVGSAIDFFRLWSIVLTAIGFACAGKVKLGTAFAIVIVWFVLLTLLFAGLGALAA